MSRYTVRHTVAGRPAGHAPTAVLTDDHSGGWRPLTWLGAPAPGGLALPQATPSMSWMYSPRGFSSTTTTWWRPIPVTTGC